MILTRFHLALLLACSVVITSPRAGPSGNPCAAPDETAGVITALPHVATVLKAGSTLNVLAIGSATLFGPEASFLPGTMTSPSTSKGQPAIPPPQIITAEPSLLAFPNQMVKALQVAVPGADIRLTVRGGRGLSASEMLDLMRTELGAHKYELVLWQTGTVEAVRNTPPGEFAQTLVDGVEAIEAANADLVLVDPQFSRFLQTNSNLDPYEQAMQQAASMPDVLLFRRFDLMRSWANDGLIDLERTAKPDRKRVVETLHACLGAHLARMVLDGARS